MAARGQAPNVLLCYSLRAVRVSGNHLICVIWLLTPRYVHGAADGSRPPSACTGELRREPGRLPVPGQGQRGLPRPRRPALGPLMQRCQHGRAARPWRPPAAVRPRPEHRYLPVNLPAPKIADELHVSSNTVRTHLRILYATLGAPLPAAVR